MTDEDFPSDSASPVIKGTIWHKPRPKALPLRPNSTVIVGAEIKAASMIVLDEASNTTREMWEPIETLAQTAERLRLQARQGHRKYRGPNFYSQFTRRAPATQVQAKDMKAETPGLVTNLVRMLPVKGSKRTVN